MKRATDIKLEQALSKAGEYIAQLEQMDDKKLQKHLDMFQQQMERAYKQKNHTAYLLLQEYERQTVQARLNKLDSSF